MLLKRQDVIELVTNIDNSGIGIKRTVDIRNINIMFYNINSDNEYDNTPSDILLENECVFINNNHWIINANNIDLDVLLIELQNIYENPYLIVMLQLNSNDPNDLYMEWLVILDFKLDIDKYIKHEV